MRGKFLGPGGSGERRESFSHLHATRKAAEAIMYMYGGFIVIFWCESQGYVKGSKERAS